MYIIVDASRNWLYGFMPLMCSYLSLHLLNETEYKMALSTISIIFSFDYIRRVDLKGFKVQNELLFGKGIFYGFSV